MSPVAGPAVSSLILAWVRSYLRTGIGVIPVGNGSWLRARVGANDGTVVVSNSYLLPIGRLYVVPYAAHNELMRRLRKCRHGIVVIKFLIGVLLLSSVVADATSSNSDRDLFVTLLILVTEIAVMVPLLVFGLRTRSFIKKTCRSVKPVPTVAVGFVSFGLALFVFFWAYEALVAYLIPTDGRDGLRVESMKSIAEDLAKDALGGSGNTLAALAMALVKAGAGFAIMLGTTLLSMTGAEALFRLGDEGAIALLTFVLLFIAASVWSYRYFVAAERRPQQRPMFT